MSYLQQHLDKNDCSNQPKRSRHSKKSSLISASQNELQTFQKLPKEILMHIFELLPIADRIRIERVSKSWQEAAKVSWRNLKEL